MCTTSYLTDAQHRQTGTCSLSIIEVDSGRGLCPLWSKLRPRDLPRAFSSTALSLVPVRLALAIWHAYWETTTYGSYRSSCLCDLGAIHPNSTLLDWKCNVGRLHSYTWTPSRVSFRAIIVSFAHSVMQQNVCSGSRQTIDDRQYRIITDSVGSNECLCGLIVCIICIEGDHLKWSWSQSKGISFLHLHSFEL